MDQGRKDPRWALTRLDAWLGFPTVMAQYLISQVRQVNGVIEFVRAGVLVTPAGGFPNVR